MSYTKTTWNSGDVITADKLNNIESGVEAASGSGSESGPLIIHGTKEGTVVTLDKTWKEIYDAFMMGIPCLYDFSDEFTTVRLCLCSNINVYNSQYNITFCDASGSSLYYSIDSENGYPYASYD